MIGVAARAALSLPTAAESRSHGHGRVKAPTWDIASTCTIFGKKGLLLVAKAHSEELKEDDRCGTKRLTGGRSTLRPGEKGFRLTLQCRTSFLEASSSAVGQDRSVSARAHGHAVRPDSAGRGHRVLDAVRYAGRFHVYGQGHRRVSSVLVPPITQRSPRVVTENSSPRLLRGGADVDSRHDDRPRSVAMPSPQMVRLDEHLQRLGLNTLPERLEALLQGPPRRSSLMPTSSTGCRLRRSMGGPVHCS